MPLAILKSFSSEDEEDIDIKTSIMELDMSKSISSSTDESTLLEASILSSHEIKTVPQKWVEPTESGSVKVKVKTVTYTSDGKVPVSTDGQTETGGKEPAPPPEVKDTMKTLESKVLEEEVRVIEETVPFSERKDFFQKLVDGHTTKETTIIPSEKVVIEKKTVKEESKSVPSEKITSPESQKGEVVEEVAPFAERIQFFRRSLEESTLAKDVHDMAISSESKMKSQKTSPSSPPATEKVPPPRPSPPAYSEKIKSPSPISEVETPPSPSSKITLKRISPTSAKKISPVSPKASEKPPRPTSPPSTKPPRPRSPPSVKSPLSISPSSEVKAKPGEKIDVPLPPPRRTKQLPLKTTPDEESVGHISPFTPDLETPKDTPEMASKSDEQKMIMVTERVAEAVTTLASTLEEAEKKLTSPKRDARSSVPVESIQPETISVLEEKISDILTMVTRHEQKLEEDLKKEKTIEKAVDDKKWEEVDSTIQEALQETETMESEMEKKEIEEERLTEDSGRDADVSSVADSSSEYDDGKAIKAEIKLLVKTMEAGKEAIEIRSIKEFVESDAKQKEPTRIFSGAMAPVSSVIPQEVVTSPQAPSSDASEVIHDHEVVDQTTGKQLVLTTAVKQDFIESPSDELSRAEILDSAFEEWEVISETEILNVRENIACEIKALCKDQSYELVKEAEAIETLDEKSLAKDKFTQLKLLDSSCSPKLKGKDDRKFISKEYHSVSEQISSEKLISTTTQSKIGYYKNEKLLPIDLHAEQYFALDKSAEVLDKPLKKIGDLFNGEQICQESERSKQSHLTFQIKSISEMGSFSDQEEMVGVANDFIKETIIKAKEILSGDDKLNEETLPLHRSLVIEINKVGLEDISLSKPSPEEYLIESSFTGDFAAAKSITIDKEIAQVSPTDESVEDHAQVDKFLSSSVLEGIDKSGKLEIELAEVRTEDEAPEIEDDIISPETENKPFIEDTQSEDLKEVVQTYVDIVSNETNGAEVGKDVVSSNLSVAIREIQKTPEETFASEQTVSDGIAAWSEITEYFKSEAVRKHATPILKHSDHHKQTYMEMKIDKGIRGELLSDIEEYQYSKSIDGKDISVQRIKIDNLTSDEKKGVDSDLELDSSPAPPALLHYESFWKDSSPISDHSDDLSHSEKKGMPNSFSKNLGEKKVSPGRKSPSPFHTPVELIDTHECGREIEASVKPIVTTPVSQRKALPTRTKSSPSSPQDITGHPEAWEAEEGFIAEPTITEPSEDIESLNILRHHSSPDFHDIIDFTGNQYKEKQDKVLRGELQDKAMEETVCPLPSKQSFPQQTIVISDVESPLSKPSPLEPPSASVEQEISPAVEYPLHLTTEQQVHVGVSPTEDAKSSQIKETADMPSESIKFDSLLGDVKEPLDITSTKLIEKLSFELTEKSPKIGSTEPEIACVKSMEFICETSDKSDTDTAHTDITVIRTFTKLQTGEAESISSGDQESHVCPTMSDLSDKEESFDQDVFDSKTDISVQYTDVKEPTESVSSIYSARTESTESETEVPYSRPSQMAFENRAFAGVDQIDITSEKEEIPTALDTSPFEVPRSIIDEKVERIEVSSFDHTSKREAEKMEESFFKREIFDSEISEALDKTSPEQKEIPISQMERDLSSCIDRQIKRKIIRDELEETDPNLSLEEKELHPGIVSVESMDRGEHVIKQIETEIFTHELDEIIDVGSLEEKVIMFPTPDMSETTEKVLAKRIKSDILTEALSESPYSQSPELKEMPVFPHEFDLEDEQDFLKFKEEVERSEVESETKSVKCASEILPEPILWEVPLQQQTEAEIEETAQEIPPSQQIIIEKDEEEEPSGDKITTEELKQTSQFEFCHIKSVKGAKFQEEIPEPKIEREESVTIQYPEAEIEETAQEIPPSQQIIIEKDEEEESSGDKITTEELKQTSQFEFCHIKSVKGAKFQEEILEPKLEREEYVTIQYPEVVEYDKSKRPPLKHIPSEISEEDLVEKFGASPDRDSIHESAESQEPLRDQRHLAETSSIDITDEEPPESAEEFSLSDLTEELKMTKKEPYEKDEVVFEKCTSLKKKSSESKRDSLLSSIIDAGGEHVSKDEIEEELNKKFSAKEHAISLQETFGKDKKESLLEEEIKKHEKEQEYLKKEIVEMKKLKDEDKILIKESKEKIIRDSYKIVDDTEQYNDKEIKTLKCPDDEKKTTKKEICESKDVHIEEENRSYVMSTVEEKKTTSLEEIIHHETEKKIEKTDSDTFDETFVLLKLKVSGSTSGSTERKTLKKKESITSDSEQESDVYIPSLPTDTVDELTSEESKISEESRRQLHISSSEKTIVKETTSGSDEELKLSEKLPSFLKDTRKTTLNGSSSGESHFYSCETDSGQTSQLTPAASRPCSSDVDALVAGAPGSSEYETCLTSQDGSSVTATLSHEYKTAATTLSHSSRESMRSIDSESSGHLGSLEVSSETSETLVPSALELERDLETPVIDEDDRYFVTTEREIYEPDISQTIIRKQVFKSYDFASGKFDHAGEVKYEELDELSSPFEIVSESEIADYDDILETDSVKTVQDDSKQELPGKIDRTKILSPDIKIRGFTASPDTDDTSTDYHSASEGKPIHMTSQHSDSPSTDLDQNLMTHHPRLSIPRQESGAYMPGEKVDDLSPTHEEKETEPSNISGFSSVTSLTVVRHSESPTTFIRTTTTTTTTTVSSIQTLGESPSSTSQIDKTLVKQTELYLQANGPIEVEFHPEYDLGEEERKGFLSDRHDDRPLLAEDTHLPDDLAAAEDDKIKKAKRTKSRCKEDKDDEKKEEDESEDKDKDIGDMQESEVLFGEHTFEYPRVVTSTEGTEKEASDDDLSGDEFEGDVHEDRPREQEASHTDEHQDSQSMRYQFTGPASSGILLPPDVDDDNFHQELEIDRPESELRDLDISRPHSHAESFYSRSDSDQRPYSELQFSDDRPDSELTELMRQSYDSKETAEELERPLSPEPKDEYRIDDEGLPEAMASVTELEEEYGVPQQESNKIEEEKYEHSITTTEEITTVYTKFHSELTFGKEKHELETSERSSHDKLSLCVDIPDITVTQCHSPKTDKTFTYIKTGDDQKPTPEVTPSTDGSDKASDSASSQEYILDRVETISEEPETIQEFQKSLKDINSFMLLEKSSATDETVTKAHEAKFAVQLSGKENLPDVCSVAKDAKLISREIDDSPTSQSDKIVDILQFPTEFSRNLPSDPIPIQRYAESIKDSEESFPESFDSEKGSKESQESFKFIKDLDQDAPDWIEFHSKEKDQRLIAGYGYQMDFEKDYGTERELYLHDETLEDILEEGEKQDEDEEEKQDRESSNCKESTRSTPDFDILAGRKYFSKSGEHDDISMSSLQEFERLEAEIIRGDRRSSLGSQDSLNGRKVNSRSGQGDDVSISSLQEFEHLETECSETEKSESVQQEEVGRLSEIEEGHESQVSESESQETLSEHVPEDDSDVDDYEKRMFEIDEIIRQAQSNVEKFEAEIIKGSPEKLPLKTKKHPDSGSGGSGNATESTSLHEKTSSGAGEENDVDSLEEEVKELEFDSMLPQSLDTTLKEEHYELDQATLAQHVIVSRTLSSESSPHQSRGHSSASTTTQYDVESLKEREHELEESDAPTFERDECDEDSLQGDDPTDVFNTKPDKEPDVDSLQEDKPSEPKDDMDSDSLKGDITTQDVSSSGYECDRDSLSKAVCGDIMISSTDSLEPSSSTATHATYQYETDSIMSSSFASVQTSGEESTMISSTDTLDPELRRTPPHISLEDVQNMFLEQKTGYQYIDSEGNLQTHTTKTYTDTEGNIHSFPTFKTDPTDESYVFPKTIKQTVMMDPEVRTVTFAGPDAEKQMKEFIEKFQPGQDVVEMETTDEQGNLRVVRTVQHRVVMQPHMTTVKFSGPDAEDKLQEFMNKASKEFPSTDDEDVVETVDEDGTVHRVIRRRIIQPEVQTMTFSGPDARKQMEQFMKNTLPDFDPKDGVSEIETKDSSGNLTRVLKHSIITPHSPQTYTSIISGDQRFTSETKLSHATVHSSPDLLRHTHTTSFSSTPPTFSPQLSRRESSPSSPTHSSSSHSEDCYCGPEAEASVPPDPNGIQHTGDAADLLSSGDGQTRTVHRSVRTVTTVGPDGEQRTTVVEMQDGGKDGGDLEQSMQAVLDQFVKEKSGQ